MEFSTIFLIAVALAVDAFAVAIATGVCLPKVSFRHMFRLAWHFGLFQAGMNIIGWAAGLSVRAYIDRLDHWLAFGLLTFVGGRMIIEALETLDDKERCEKDPTRGRNLIMLSVATSIDALAVGLSFAMLKTAIWFPALIIGVVATAGTAIGIHLGHAVGSATRLGRRVEIAGGLVLIGIGLRILHEHGVFS
jgi:putative Mn2+ efflux pump MntP